MKLLTKEISTKLIQQDRATSASGGDDLGHKPVCKFFVPWGAGTWLISELDPETNTAFGLCDLGMGSPELGYVSLDEIASIQGPAGLRIERDRHWVASKPLTEYADEARRKQRIEA